MKKELYETHITDARWWVYDILGNIGWILYNVMVVIGFTKHQKIAASCISAVPAVLMLIGIAELIRERIKKLDRVLPKGALIRGFGALTLGGLLGAICGIAGAVHHFSGCHIAVIVGSLMCFIFAGLLLKGYKKG